MTIKGQRLFTFRFFKWRVLIWEKIAEVKPKSGVGVGPKEACRLVRHNNHIGLAMPDGTVIPYQVDLKVKAPLNDVATATIKVFVTIPDNI